jgi:iron complex outermembrane receptor protein
VKLPPTVVQRRPRHRTPHATRARPYRLPVLAVGVFLFLARAPFAQEAPATATVTAMVRHGDEGVRGAIVRALAPSGVPARAPVVAQTDDEGRAILRLPAGAYTLIASRLGFGPDTLALVLRAGQDTTVTFQLEEAETALAAVIVSATRGERRVEDTPLRVEVIEEEEVAEKVAMTPGDVAMMLNETSGLRVQVTNPSLGGANVRMLGLRGRYSLLLADGLPLYGGQAGGLGLLQIPPVDLARVEVIKGTASALYGSAALGGVVNLLSKRPGEEPERTILLNQTSRGGTDGVFFGGGPLAGRWGYTLLAGAHRQSRHDADSDGWTDLPGYRRAVLRPRFSFDDGAGRTAFITGGFTGEEREGGTLPGRVIPNDGPYVEALRTRRADLGGLARWVFADTGAAARTRALHGAIVTVRAAAAEQRHRHRFGDVREEDRHRTAFGEAALALPRGALTWVGGLAVQQDAYRSASVSGFDFTWTIPAAFAQLDADPTPWLSTSVSARLDAHSEYGTMLNPRVSLLLRRTGAGVLEGWTTRLSAGSGVFAPTPFTEETDAAGLTVVDPPRGLVAERAWSGSLDVGGPIPTPLGKLDLNLTAFGSRIRRAVHVRASPGSGGSRLLLENAVLPTVTWGADAFARLRIEEVLSGDLGMVATYVFLRSTEEDPERGGRREVPLTPRHSAGLDLIWEAEGRARVGLEFFYTGRQALDENPFRVESRPYLLVGLLGEVRVDRLRGARLFVNSENLTGVRQTRWDPLLLPSPGLGGRRTTDAWTELSGATVNAGVRVAF